MSNMDFPKGCSSNVHVVGNLAQTRFYLFRWKDDKVGSPEERQHTQEIIITLREENILCSREEGGLWAFGDLAAEQKEALTSSHTGLILDDEGKVEDQAAKRTSEGKPAKSVLLDAIESAIAYRLAKDSAVVHVGRWTWIHDHLDNSDEQLGMESTVMQLHARFTSTGSLYLVPQLFVSTWFPAHKGSIKAEIDVIAAPHGRLAKLLPDDSAVKNPVSGTTWRSQVQRLLDAEGIRVTTDEHWRMIRFLDDGLEDAFEWPARLCFVHRESPLRDPSGSGTCNWSLWFSGVSSSDAFRNPLATAEEWFLGAAAREHAAQQAGIVDSNVTGLDESVGSGVATLPQNGVESTPATSPAFNQRIMEQQAAMAGIYPTPPDGLTQSQPMPNINAVTTPSVMQAEQSSLVGDLLPTSDDGQFKGPDFNPSDEPETYPLGQEDLFGDVEEMEFGDHEVGDADFNFFDEPDEEPVIPPVEDATMADPVVSGTDDDADPAIAAETTATETQDVDSHMNDSAPEDAIAFEGSKTPQPSLDLRIPSDSIVIHDQPPVSSITEPERPLSPFGIRERLLPPPVPASMTQNNATASGDQRRTSVFSPISFRDSLHSQPRCAEARISADGSRLGKSQPNEPDITLPSTRKKSRLLKRDDTSDEESDSEDESYESESSESEQDLPPRLPWDNRKRKRHVNHDAANSIAWFDMPDVEDNVVDTDVSPAKMAETLEKCCSSNNAFDITRLCSDGDPVRTTTVPEHRTLDSTTSMPFVEDIYDLRKDDLICIAQVISEMSITTIETAVQPSSADTMSTTSSTTALETLLKRTLTRAFLEAEICDLGKIALTREPPPRPGITPGKTPQGQPRPLQRTDSMMLGPDYFPLTAPYVRIQRGADNWEMLSASLCFWETLGLGPASGPKNIRAFCLFPSNEDLQHVVEQFIGDIGTAFENCKLGSHVHLRNAIKKDELDNYEDGMAPVELTDDSSLEGALKAYAASSVELGTALSSISQGESDRTIVIYMVNPFEEPSTMQHLCACFWLLFKAYRDNLPKARRNQCIGDIVLQLLPIDVLASCDALVVPDARRMAMLAREVYDRCPPSNSTRLAENMSPLPILVAPSVELASTAPKRIAFQLAADPPGDLLHEGSVLHLAYALSRDKHWLTAAWIDSTGQHQATVSFCLRGKTIVDVFEDVWERTREIITARQVTWRIFILTSETVDRAISQCWRVLAAKPRTQALCVTLLSAQTDPTLQLFPPATAETSTKETMDAGFLTPASTPQGNNFTSSPDVSGHGNAPLTPAPSETAASIAENDPDAHLTDMADETWGVLLSSKLTYLASNTGIANGILFKRGDVDATPTGYAAASSDKLPSLGLSLHWTIQVKPSGGVDEGNIRQSELTLRELLKLYRNLALLTRAKGLDYGETKLVPLHVAMAVRGVRGLEGMLAPVGG